MWVALYQAESALCGIYGCMQATGTGNIEEPSLVQKHLLSFDLMPPSCQNNFVTVFEPISYHRFWAVHETPIGLSDAKSHDDRYLSKLSDLLQECRRLF